MNTDLKLPATLLPHGAVHALRERRGTLLQCLSGTLWLTQQDDVRDIVLEAGDKVLIERDGLSLVSALSDTCFVLLCGPGTPRP